MKVKICGITNKEDALVCERAGADALGFIFYRKSKRYIAPGNAAEISRSLSPFTAKVGVFVDEQPGEINEAAERAGLNLIQLYGTDRRIETSSVYLPLIDSFRVNDGFDFSVLNKSTAPYVLLDSYSDAEFGGTGKSFDWNCIPENLRGKIILAGGISGNNLEEIYNNVRPAAIDVSSSLEIIPGKKDYKKVGEFFELLNRLRYLC